MLEVHCPDCRTPVPLLAQLAGRDVFCLGCGSHFAMPKLQPGEQATVVPPHVFTVVGHDLSSERYHADCIS